MIIVDTMPLQNRIHFHFDMTLWLVLFSVLLVIMSCGFWLLLVTIHVLVYLLCLLTGVAVYAVLYILSLLPVWLVLVVFLIAIVSFLAPDLLSFKYASQAIGNYTEMNNSNVSQS